MDTEPARNDTVAAGIRKVLVSGALFRPLTTSFQLRTSTSHALLAMVEDWIPWRRLQKLIATAFCLHFGRGDLEHPGAMVSSLRVYMCQMMGYSSFCQQAPACSVPSSTCGVRSLMIHDGGCAVCEQVIRRQLLQADGRVSKEEFEDILHFMQRQRSAILEEWLWRGPSRSSNYLPDSFGRDLRLSVNEETAMGCVLRRCFTDVVLMKRLAAHYLAGSTD